MRSENSNRIRVAVPVPLREPLTYRVPRSIRGEVQAGVRVLVPLQVRKAVGYVLGEAGDEGPRDLKDVLDVLDPEPVFPESMVPFFEWLADYYLYPVGRLIEGALPGGLTAGPPRRARLTEKGMRYLDRLPYRCEERDLLQWLRDHPEGRPPVPHSKVLELEKEGLLRLERPAPRRLPGPTTERFVRIREGLDLHSFLNSGEKPLRARDERAFLEAVARQGSVAVRELRARFPTMAYLVRKWRKKGILEVLERASYRNPAGEILRPVPVPEKLYGQQERALGEISSRLKRGGFCAFLLHGVTGSGKTEVYYRAALRALEAGRQVIVMVPEIALAVYMEGIFRSRLGDRVTLYHSALGGAERRDQWIRMARGDVDLVVGARSAVFAPFDRLGLIIVDEEHDESYKQEDGIRYHARDAAVMRAKMAHAVVVLGSGTPSVQSVHNGLTGRYRLISMPHRIEKRPPPQVEVVNMKDLPPDAEGRGMISPVLREALARNLEQGFQSMLFLNRRGYHRLFVCPSCGKSVQCPNCDVALTHHFHGEALVCHYCGFSAPARMLCPHCSCGRLRSYGFGTEKLESGLAGLFPEARVARMDADSTRRKGSAMEILKRFGTGQIDILVGTQMITKGFDFPRVTLVGIVSADLSLAFPDFRAAERTFQILSQVAGRAGRGENKGRVIIQTFNPDHYAVQAAVAHDYKTFLEKELGLREELGYPPFRHLACLTFLGNSEGRTETFAELVGRGIREILAGWRKRGSQIQILGPVESPVGRLKGKYRRQILLKARNSGLMRHLILSVEERYGRRPEARGVRLIVDVDPYQMT
ncbi:MAG: primosomal protein N' [Deltaproteobacteria bacterium]|nr:MAG: primosomal protein N' [Deltaproteobacteria bacterium]